VVPGSTPRSSDIVEPGEPGSGYTFESAIVGGNVPREFWPAVEKGFRVSVVKGVLAGYPLVDLKVTLTDGGYHAVDLLGHRVRYCRAGCLPANDSKGSSAAP